MNYPIEADYNKHVRMIKSRAKQYARPGYVGIEFEDLFSLGNEVWMDCAKKYSPAIKCKFSTFLYGELTRRLWQAVYHRFRWKKQNFLDNNPSTSEDKEIYADQELITKTNTNAEQEFMFFESLDTLSEDAQEILNIVMDLPDDKLEHMSKTVRGYRVTMRTIQRYLVDVRNWKESRVWNSFAEIKSVLN